MVDGIDKITRREFLIITGGFGGALIFPKGETWKTYEKDEVLDVEPSRIVTNAVWPVEGEKKEITRTGLRHLQPYRRGGGRHIGVDFNVGEPGDGDLGEPIKVIMDGVCIFVGDGTVNNRDLGKIVIFRHQMPDGRDLFSRYAHLDSWYPTTIPGENYVAGTPIGAMGKSGWEHGFVHLHMDLANIRFYEAYLKQDSRINLDPWYYPCFQRVENINFLFEDPVKVIEDYMYVKRRIQGVQYKRFNTNEER